MTSRLVDRGPIASAVGLILATTNIGTLLGPGIGGALIGTAGVAGVLIVSATGSLVAVGAQLLMAPVPRDPSVRSLGVLRSIAEVFGYVWRDRLFRPVFVVVIIISVLARPVTQMFPAVAKTSFTSVRWSWRECSRRPARGRSSDP